MGRRGPVGQTPALPKRMWKQWLQWLQAKDGARIYVVVPLTGAFGLRMGEALALKAEDIDLQAENPKLKVAGDTCGNRKSPGDVYIRKRHLKFLRDMFRNGVTAERDNRHTHGKGAQQDHTNQGCTQAA